MKSPIFLFSLPRSGSTLLQRVLMSHEEIASVAEPWLMLPFCYALKKEGVLAEYSHDVSFKAINEFINNLPNKEMDYYNALGSFSSVLYEKQCLNNEMYFLDKTPRYYHIITEISKAFPNAKFIFLFRNPVNVMSSMIQTWANGRLNKMYNYNRDLNFGPQALSEGFQLLRGKAYAIQYEEYVKEPEKYTKEICKYLDIRFKEEMLKAFSDQNTRGNMGDSTGIRDYKIIETKPLCKWKNTFNTRFRKNYINGYVKSIDKKIFDIQGYNKKEILNDIESLEVDNKNYLSDKTDLIYSDLVQFLKLNIWFGARVKNWAKNTFLS